ncbi:MAG: type II/IV secretion system protein, partial [Microcystis panniformis]
LGLQRLVIAGEDYERLLEKFYQAQSELEREKARLQKEKELEKLSDLTDIVGSLDLTSGVANDEVTDDLGEGNANQAPVINLVNKIIAKALQEGSSDIHIEPQEEFLKIR